MELYTQKRGANAMSKVSVIVPNWNGKNYLEKCLLSLKGQTYEDLEVIG